MEKTHLIQRLKKPTERTSPFSFGGGLRNGGIPKGGMGLLSKICSFDHMGVAEFEYGAVPEALDKIWDYSNENHATKGLVHLPKDVHYICEKGTQKYVEDIIQKLYKNETKLYLKEPTFLRGSIQGKMDIKGWLELDNAFMFFIDNEMYKKTLDLFKIK